MRDYYTNITILNGIFYKYIGDTFTFYGINTKLKNGNVRILFSQLFV